MAVRVLLADDHPLARAGAATLLGSQLDIEIVGEAEDGVEAVTRYRALRPDVLVLDLRMPGIDGVSVTKQVCREDPQARVLILTHYDGDEDVFSALRAGARGYLTKDARPDTLIAAVRAVASGARYYPPEVANRLAERLNQDSLSARELQVLERVAEGLTNRAAAATLGITDHTVALHVGNILSKLGAKTRAEAVAVALQRGLLRRK